ncbi:unnamed protein product, partial [Polarella glacialis]
KHAARLGSACESSLRGLVALQHFFDLDLGDQGDLSLPRELRRSDDEFVDETGPNQDVSLQMVMDATRALYVVEGATMDFASELSASGLDLEEVPHEVERLKADFADRLVQCVRSCLGSHAHSCPELLRAVTNAMSQSGLANMERACSDCPQVVVSGGEQRLVFDLRRADALGVATWALHLLVEKTDFESCLAVVDEEPLPRPCGLGSRLARSACVHFSLTGFSATSAIEQGAVVVDAQVLGWELLLVDMCGRPFMLPPPPADPISDDEAEGPGSRQYNNTNYNNNYNNSNQQQQQQQQQQRPQVSYPSGPGCGGRWQSPQPRALRFCFPSWGLAAVAA